MKTITIRLPEHLIEELPEEESTIYEILNLKLHNSRNILYNPLRH